MSRASNDIDVGGYIPCRLDKYLREALGFSRAETQRAWKAGRIELAGAEHVATIVMPEDEVRVDGEVVAPQPPTQYYVFHKPEGVVTANSDPNKPSLEPWMRELGSRVVHTGRLDRATTGLLLLTDDGDLVHVLLHPDFHVEKVYELTFERDVSDDELQTLVDGVELDDGPAAARSHRRLGPHSAEIVMTEGRNRIVRRMCKTTRLPLLHLHRSRFATLSLGELAAGELRALTDDEVEEIWTHVGGRDAVWHARAQALVNRAAFLDETGRTNAHLNAWVEAYKAVS